MSQRHRVLDQFGQNVCQLRVRLGLLERPSRRLVEHLLPMLCEKREIGQGGIGWQF